MAPATSDEPVLLIARDEAHDPRFAHRLSSALPAELERLPSAAGATRDARALEAWRAKALGAPKRAGVVVFLAAKALASEPLASLGEAAWLERFEEPYLAWTIALGAAARRVADGGAIVAVVQTPAALDAAGWVPEASIADGVVAWIRSIAAAEGGRGVRAHAVTTPVGLVEEVGVAPAPPLACFPGRIDVEVAGAVRLLLSPEATGLTGRSIAADGGRSVV